MISRRTYKRHAVMVATTDDGAVVQSTLGIAQATFSTHNTHLACSEEEPASYEPNAPTTAAL